MVYIQIYYMQFFIRTTKLKAWNSDYEQCVALFHRNRGRGRFGRRHHVALPVSNSFFLPLIQTDFSSDDSPGPVFLAQQTIQSHPCASRLE